MSAPPKYGISDAAKERLNVEVCRLAWDQPSFLSIHVCRTLALYGLFVARNGWIADEAFCGMADCGPVTLEDCIDLALVDSAKFRRALSAGTELS